MPARTSSTTKRSRPSKPRPAKLPTLTATPEAVAVPASRPPASPEPWDDAELHQIRDALDHATHAGLARLTAGLSPAAIVDAFMDWAVHLAISPGKQVELATRGLANGRG